MYSRGIKKHASNPAIGLLPFIIYIVLHTLNMNEGYAIIISLGVAIIGEILFRLYLKTRGFNIVFYITILSLTFTLVTWYFTERHVHKFNSYIVLCEVFIVCLFMVLRLSKTYISTFVFRQKNLLQKALLNESYQSAAFVQYGLTLHIFGIMLYRQFVDADTTHIPGDFIVFTLLPILMILGVGAYQIFKVTALFRKLKKEEWLPIVTERGEVTGKIAKSVSLNMKNRFLHPVVRVALISGSKVYLQERALTDMLDPGKLDYPFEKFMLFNHEINLAARNSIVQMVGSDLDVTIKFVLKYVFENDETKRLNFLFTASIDDEDAIRREGKMKGKFWTIKQIEDGFADEIYSECFELEFEYLKNMVILGTDIKG